MFQKFELAAAIAALSAVIQNSTFNQSAKQSIHNEVPEIKNTSKQNGFHENPDVALVETFDNMKVENGTVSSDSSLMNSSERKNEKKQLVDNSVKEELFIHEIIEGDIKITACPFACTLYYICACILLEINVSMHDVCSIYIQFYCFYINKEFIKC